MRVMEDGEGISTLMKEIYFDQTYDKQLMRF